MRAQRSWPEILRSLFKNATSMALSPGDIDCPMHLINMVAVPSHVGILQRLALSLQGAWSEAFNEINMILHAPFMGSLCFEEGEERRPIGGRVSHQLAHSDQKIRSAVCWRQRQVSYSPTWW